MAHTTAFVAQEVEGINTVKYVTISFSGTYATGGEAVTAAEFGLASIESVQPNLAVSGAGTTVYNARFNSSTSKIQLYVAAAGAEFANGASLTDITLTARVVGN